MKQPPDNRAKLFSETLKRAWSRLQRLSLNITRGSADADDLLQESLLVSFMKFGTFAPDSNFCAWVGQTMRFIHANQRRRWNTHSNALRRLSWECLNSGGDRQPDTETDQILSTLDSMYRIPVLLADYYGFTYGQIAELLDAPPGTIMSRLHRGRQLARRLACLPPLTQTVVQVMARFAGIPGQVRWSAVVFDWRARKAMVAAERTSLKNLPGRGTTLPLSDFPRRAILRRGPVRSVDDLTVAGRHRPRVWGVLLQAGIRSFMTAPIIVQGVLSGELNISARIPGAFSRGTEDTMATMAERIGTGWRDCGFPLNLPA